LQPKRVWARGGSLGGHGGPAAASTSGGNAGSGRKWVLQLVFDGLLCQPAGDDSVDVDLPSPTAQVQR